MAHKPSERTNRLSVSQELNLTSLIDIISTIMFFLLIFLGMLPVVIIDAPIPKVATTAEEVRRAKETRPDIDVTVWIKNNGFSVRAGGASINIPKNEKGEYLYKDLHNYLVKIHSQYPKIKDVTLVPDDNIIYDVLVETMDSARALEKGDIGYQTISPDIIGKPESAQFNQLFPEIIIGGV